MMCSRLMKTFHGHFAKLPHSGGSGNALNGTRFERLQRRKRERLQLHDVQALLWEAEAEEDNSLANSTAQNF